MTAKKPSTRRNKAGTSRQAAEDRRLLFARAYVANGGNKTQAAISAGYSPKSAERQGIRMSGEVRVKALIADLAARVSDKFELTADLVVRSIVQELTFDPARLYHEDGTLKSIADLDEDIRMALTSIEFEQQGSAEAPIYVRKVKWATRQAAREQAMKYLGMFREDNKQKAGLLADLPREVLKEIAARLQELSDQGAGT